MLKLVGKRHAFALQHMNWPLRIIGVSGMAARTARAA
jgi:hypothetical protein